MGGKKQKFQGKPYSWNDEAIGGKPAKQHNKRGSGNGNYHEDASWNNNDRRNARQQRSNTDRARQQGSNHQFGASGAPQRNGERSVREHTTGETGGTYQGHYHRETNGQVKDRQQQGSNHQYGASGAPQRSGERSVRERTIGETGGTYQGHHHREINGQAKDEEGKLNILQCRSCQNFYHRKDCLPRTLLCGHSVCSVCLTMLLKDARRCQECGKPLGDKQDLESFPPNFQLLDIIEAEFTKENAGERREEKRLCRTSLEHSKPVVTLGSEEPGKIAPGDTGKRDRPISHERSPHGSKCLDYGIKPSYHCALCLKWVCEKCGNIDHRQSKCHLIPKAEALDQMKEAQLDGAKTAKEALESTLTELVKYEESLDSFSFAMQAAFEAVVTEKERVKSMKEDGVKKIKGLNAVVEDLPNAKNLPDALAALGLVEDKCRGTQVWQEENLIRTLDQRKVLNITKEILLCTVFMKLMAEKEHRPIGHLLAQHHINGETLYSQLEANGGRVLVHALKEVKTVPAGSRAMSLNSILACLDNASSLTFLDIGWNGVRKERVFIRLTGDTVRGRQFLALCTGLLGPSFRKTPFHRIWWKKRPGEHLWTGDYDQGNGSGGTSLLEHMKEEIKGKPLGRKVPITAGLVAGRYEQSHVSSVFRIYTKGHGIENRRGAYGGFSDVPEEPPEDEAAFGQVEHGLSVLQDVVELGNIQDVRILDCGIVIETGMLQ